MPQPASIEHRYTDGDDLVQPTDRVLTVDRLLGSGYAPPESLPLAGEADCVALPGLRIRWPQPEPPTLPSMGD